MNAPAKIPRPWNYNSHVKVCAECNGAGTVRAERRATVNDPYPETACDCGLGEHEPCCEVCGYNLPIAGYDCLACETANSLYASDLAKFDADTFAAALKVAVSKALNEAIGKSRQIQKERQLGAEGWA